MRSALLAPPVLALSLLVGLAGWQLQSQYNQRQLSTRLEDQAARLERRLLERVRSYEHGLRGMRGQVLALGFDGIGIAQFERYMRSRDLPREFPGMRGTGLIRRVPLAAEQGFLSAMQAQRPDFRIRALTEHEGERYVIQYLAPLADNRAAVGLDIASDPLRRSAADAALRSGQAQLTPPISLVQAPGQPALLMLLPIYPDGQTPASEAERIAQGLGWAYAPLVVSELLHSLDLGDAELKLQLSDAGQPFYDSSEGLAQFSLEATRSLQLLGRAWQLRLLAAPRYAERMGLPEARLVGLVSGLLTLLALSLLVAAAQARRRRRQLDAERLGRAAVVDASSDAHLLLDTEARIRDWSLGAERLLGHAAAQVMERDAIALLFGITPEAKEERARLQRLAEGEAQPPQDRVCHHADGRSIDVSLAAAALHDARGRLSGFVLTLRDIAAAKVLERQMRELNAELERQVRERTALLDRVGQMAAVGGWQYELSSGEIRWTAETYRIHGVPPDYRPRLEEALDFYAPEAHALMRKALGEALRDGKPWDLELPFRPRDGRRTWVRAVGVPIYEGERIVRMQGAFQDISEAKRIESELRRTGSLLRTVLDSASELAIIATDAEQRIQVFNRGAERMLGYRAAEVLGRHAPATLLHDPEELAERERQLSAELARPLRPGELFTLASRLHKPFRWTYITKDGRRLPVSLVVTPMTGDAGENLGYLGIAQDITLQQQREAALQEATQRAEQANAAKSQFLANMSHEIRTPMNAVIGLAYLLAQTRLDAEQSRFVARIRGASQGLLEILNDILDLSKIEAGELIIEQRGFDPRALLEQVQELYAAQAEAKGLRLQLALAEPLPPPLRGDALRLRQVLTNLLSNALKFTDSGGVTLRLSARRQEEGWLLRYEVEDSGIGIPEAAQATVFRAFAQADSSTTRQYGGTGLGLAIVRQLVEGMGGQIGLRSRPGEGSCFWVELALDEASETERAELLASSAPQALQRLDGVRVLVADDSEINVEVASRMLVQQGATVFSAADGAAAVACVERLQGALDIVLMDLQMPVLDGCAAAERIRALPLGGTLPIVALTAGTLASERQRALDVGMNAFLSKPFLPAELMATVAAALGGREVLAPPAATLPGAWPALPGIDVDAVRARLGDDLPLFGRLLRQLLAEAGSSWWEAEALHKLRGAAGNLGASRLHQLATAGEAAARAGDRQSLAAMQQPLAEALAALQACLLRLPEPTLRSGGVPLDGAALEALRSLLQQQNLAALARSEALAAALQQRLGDAGWAQYQQALAALRFAEAAALLPAAP